MSLTLNDMPSGLRGGDESSMPVNEHSALLALYQNASLQQKLYVTGRLSLEVPTSVLFALQKLRFLSAGDEHHFGKELRALLQLVSKIQAVEIVGKEGEGRDVDCGVFPELRKLCIRKLVVRSLSYVTKVVELTLVESRMECSLRALETVRQLSFDRSVVSTKQLSSVTYSLRWMRITLNPGEFQSALWKPPTGDEVVDQLMPWEALTNVELCGTRVAFQKLDSSWERLVNLTTLTITDHDIRSLKQLEVLQRCVNLLSLDVSHNQLSSMEYIQTIGPNLVRLNASFNAIDSLGGVYALQKLKHLLIEGNQISEWGEIKDLASGCPQLVSLQFASNPMINKFVDKDDIIPFTASIFNFRSLLVNGTKSEGFKGKVTAEFISKYIPMFERYRGGHGDERSTQGGESTAASGRLRSTSRRTGGARSRTSAASEGPQRMPRKRRVVRGQVQVDRVEEKPQLPESQLDFDDTHQTEYTNCKIDASQLKEQLGDKWLQQIAAMRTAQKIGGGGSVRKFPVAAKQVVPLAPAPGAVAAATAAEAEKPRPQPKQAAAPLAAGSARSTANANSVNARGPTVSPTAEGGGGIPSTASPTARKPGTFESRASMRRTVPAGSSAEVDATATTKGATGSSTHSTPTTSATTRAALETPIQAGIVPSASSTPSAPPSQTKGSGGVTTPAGATTTTTASAQTSASFRSATGGGVASPTTVSTPGSATNRAVRTTVALGEGSASKVPRQNPTRAPIPLLQAFLDHLTTHDWTYRENDQRVKAFPSGASVYLSAICEENDRLWGITDAKAEASSLSKPQALVDVHATALEILVHDSRDGSHSFSDRHYLKTLVRVVDVHSGTTRYIRLEASSVDERGAVPQWSGRPLMTLTLDTAAPTQPLDINFDVITAEQTRGAASSSRRLSDRDRFDNEGSAGDTSVQINRDFFRVAKAKLLAAFVIPKGQVAQIFIGLLKQQLLACHDRLCTAGIMKEWPLHLDDAVVSKDRDRSIPVKITQQYIQERISKHQDEDVSRQRVGCPVIVTGDELRLNIKSYIFVKELAKESFLATVYANLVDDPMQYHETAVLVIMTSTYLLLVNDHNFQGGSTSPEETFTIIARLPLSMLQLVVVSFNLQSIRFEIDEDANYVIHTRDAGNTLTLLSAFQQATASNPIKADFKIEPCGYPDLTKAPLIFSVALFMRPLGVPMRRRTGEVSFPARHLAEVLDPVTLVITSTEIVLVQETDVLTDLHTCIETLKRPVQAIKAFCVPSKEVFPLIFAIDSNNLQEGRLERWIFAAQHPNTIAYVFTELKARCSNIDVKELSMPEYEGRPARR